MFSVNDFLRTTPTQKNIGKHFILDYKPLYAKVNKKCVEIGVTGVIAVKHESIVLHGEYLS